MQERVELQSVVKKLKGTGQKVRRAQILLKADADGPNWTDERYCRGVLVSDENGREDSANGLLSKDLTRRSTESNA